MKTKFEIIAPCLLALASALPATAADTRQFDALMNDSSGQSLEEKIYQLWQGADGHIPDFKNISYNWIGLNVSNVATHESWDGNYGSPYIEKNQKFRLSFRQVSPLTIGNLEVAPGGTFALPIALDNFDGNLDLDRDHFHRMGLYVDMDRLRVAGRSDLGDPGTYILQPVQADRGSLIVTFPTLEQQDERFQPFEFRQLDANTLVGIRRMNTTGKPCPNSNAVMRKEFRVVEEDDTFLGIHFVKHVKREVEVVDHYETAPDYALPGICDVQFLLDSQRKS